MDRAYNALIALDQATGTRTIVSDSRRGRGPVLNAPGSFALDPTRNRALVVDISADPDGEPGPSVLVAIDLDTGDRTILSDSDNGTGPDFAFPNAITLDRENNRALVADYGAAALIEVDLATGKRTIVSDRNTGSGPSFGSLDSIALDTPNHRAFGIDSESQALFIINLAPGTDADRAIVSM